MGDILLALGEAAHLIGRFDTNLVAIVALSLKVSLAAVTIATVIGLPVGAVIGVTRFPGRPT